MTEVRVGQRWKRNSTGTIWEAIPSPFDGYFKIISPGGRSFYLMPFWMEEFYELYTLIEEPADEA